MREILFRGKRVDTGEWIEGLLGSKRTILVESPLGNIDEVVILPETVGQHTGLYGKGKPIFEGDIIKARIEGGNYDTFTWPNMQVGFQFGAFCLSDRKGLFFCALGGFAPRVTFEVIGNIHDNPELLGEGDEK